MTEYPNPGVRIGAFGVQGRFSGEFLLSALFSGELAGPSVLMRHKCRYSVATTPLKSPRSPQLVSPWYAVLLPPNLFPLVITLLLTPIFLAACAIAAIRTCSAAVTRKHLIDDVR